MSYTTVNGLLTGVADAIRAKDGTSAAIATQDMPAKIAAIPSGVDTSDATATAAQIADGRTAYGANGTKLTGEGAGWQYFIAMNSKFENNTKTGSCEIWYPSEEAMVANTISAMFRYAAFSSVLLANIPILVGAFGTFQQCPNLTNVTLYGKYGYITSPGFGKFLYKSPNLVTVDGDPFDFTITTDTGQFTESSPQLTTIRFVPNTIKVNIDFRSNINFTNDTWLSVANGLYLGGAATIVLPTSKQSYLTSTFKVNNNSGTAVAGTAMAYTAFITGVKGWTISWA